MKAYSPPCFSILLEALHVKNGEALGIRIMQLNNKQHNLRLTL